MRSLALVFRACAVAASLTVIGATALAGVPAPVGKRALLSSTSAGAATLTAKDRKSLEDGLKEVNLEVDTQTGKNWLMLAVVSYAMGELQCHIIDRANGPIDR